MGKKKKILISGVLGIIAIIGMLFGGGYYYVKNKLDKVEKVDINVEELGIDKELTAKYGNIQNIALFGIDNVDGMKGRSDSIMILTINREKKTLKVSSIMRDSYVTIAGKGIKDKINHAYAFGGPEMAIRTLNESFNLNIKEFIAVDFASLPEIIDTIGGIELEIDEEELKYINSYISDLNKLNKTENREITKPGKTLVSGTEAMAYCRIRYTSGGDYKRTERHREILGKIFEKVQKISPTEYPKFLDKILPLVKTNLESKEVMDIGLDIVKIGGNLQESRFPKDEDCKGEMIDGVYYLSFNKDTTIKKMHEWIFN
ncbi:MAG: LCP family protein [Clostridium sp.]|uniref:LCP family protein n=1 Tax=Clostridium sp. TaxID=1506 RepID=UPI003F35697B